MLVFGFLVSLHSANARASEAIVTEVKPDSTVVIYWEINLGGTVWLSIRSATGAGCAELYWKTYPFFMRRSLGVVCGNTKLDIPGLGQAAAGASLHAKSQGETLKIIGSSRESVAFNFPPVSFP
jgi:hypothetical protein